MTHDPDEYAEFVEHPRYGRGPRITGLNPGARDHGVRLHWSTMELAEIAAQYEAAFGSPWAPGDVANDSGPARRIANTAIAANLALQSPATVAVTHYFDLERKCRDCGRPFIFFAAEQQHWYEELGFGLDSDCVRCVDCRKRQQGIARQRANYEALVAIADKTFAQKLEMADACLSLIEAGAFTHQQTQRVRGLLNSIPQDAASDVLARCAGLLTRVVAAEK